MTALAYLSRSLGLEIVAEGVETESQFNILKTLGYDQIQGYFLSRPVALSELKNIANAPLDHTHANIPRYLMPISASAAMSLGGRSSFALSFGRSRGATLPSR